MTAFGLKAVAMGAMLADHVGALLLPGVVWLRLVGRLALPLFAFLVGEGYRRTGDLRAYLGRLGLFAVVSQLPYTLAFGWRLNIGVTLLLGLVSVWALDRLRWRWAGGAVAVGLACVGEAAGVEYGSYGVLLVVASWWLLERGPEAAVGLVVFLVGSAWWLGWGQALAVGAVPLVLAYNGRTGPSLGRWWYGFYPVHLLALVVLRGL